ncbi:MAG: hypothetical protein ACM3PU_01590 [Gemmatimonadota bacterium]
MSRTFRWLAMVVAVACGSAWGQQSTYQNGTLTIPSVQVGAETYSATLAVINASPLTLRLTGATLQTPPQQTVNIYNPVTGKVSLPEVNVVGAGVYTAVELTLQPQQPGLTFIVTAATAPAPPPTAGNASQCLNTTYLTAGTHYVLNYQSLTGTTVNGTSSSDILITGPQTFNGQSAIESQSNTTTTNAQGTSTAQAWSYLQVQNLDLLLLGTKVNASSSGFNTQTVVTFSPPPIWRYSLNAGESLKTNWTGTSTTSITGTPFPIPPTTSTFSGFDTYEFDGFEDVTVPAGSFTGACKWKHTLTQTVNGQTSSSTTTQWITRKGAMLKSDNGTDILELTSGTVNGGSVGP